MKKFIIFIIFLPAINIFSQEIRKDLENSKTKMESFSSQSGVITKFTDTNLSKLRTSYTSAETRIRKVSSGDTELYFYQIEKANEYENVTASIEYSDLLEIIKALEQLKLEVDKDVKSNPDYMENKFITEDGFQLGYYISKGKNTWYLKLDKYGSDNTLFIKNLEKIEQNFLDAKNKIEAIKS